MTAQHPPGQPQSSPRPWYGRAWPTVLLALLIFPLTLLTVGALTRIPVLSAGTSLTTSTLPITLTAAALFALSLALSRAHRSRFRSVMTVCAGLALMSSAFVSATMLSFAQRAGVPFNLAANFTEPLKGNPKADVEVPRYTQFAGKDLGLSIWRPRNTSTPAPVLVHVHGGGWVLNDRFVKVNMQQAQWFAEQGYLVLSLDYATSDPQHQNWNIQESQIACALVWASQHAAEYGGDIHRLGIYGESAGGNLAFNVASRIANGTLKSSCGGEVPQVKAVSSLYGAPTPEEVWNGADPIFRGWLRGLLTQHLGGAPQDYPDRYAAMDSNRAAHAATPPTLWTYGANDHLVPTASTEKMLARLKELGVKSRALKIPFSDHNMETGYIAGQAWRQATLNWLRTNGVR